MNRCKSRTSRILTAAVLALSTHASLCAAQDAPPQEGAANDTPQIFLDKNPKIIAYQLKRLRNDQLLNLERKPEDPKYKPVYEALLTRKGMDRKYRQESLDAIVKMDKSEPVTELLAAIGNTEAEDKATIRDLVGMLMAQKPDALTAQREKIESMATDSESPTVKQAAYATLATADGKADRVWQSASGREGALPLVLGSVGMIENPKVRESFYPLVKPLVNQTSNEETQVAAIEAVSHIPGHEAEEFETLSGIIQAGSGPRRDAAIRSIRRIPPKKWPKEQAGKLAKFMVELVGQTPADQRTTPASAQAVQLGNELAAILPSAQGAEIKKSLRELGVRVIAIRTIREQMQYDLKYFVVQAGKPVQVVLENGDAMPHNIVITAPGAMQEVALLGGAKPPPADPNEKAYIPNTPKVLESTPLVAPDESATLSFKAPEKPGEYDYVCTFPGHWVRMYGVMLVVPDLDAWEKSPTYPSDPLTHVPLKSPKNVPSGAPAHQH